MRCGPLTKDCPELAPYLADVSREVNEALDRGEHVHLEGTNGFLLSVLYGGYPYVVAKDSTASSVAVDVGIGPRRIDEVVLVFKTFPTRVGAGAFPTEMPEEEAERRGFIEYGTVTGRRRRVGTFDFELAREAVREQQAAYEEQFRRGDLQVLRIVALLLNAVTDSSHPTEGFRISYKALPKSPAELKAGREELLALVDAGFLDRVTAYQRLNPGLDRTEAEAALAEIALQNAPGEVGQQPLAGAQLSALLQVLAAVGGGQLTPDAGAGLVLLVVPTLEPQKARDLAAGARSTAPTPSPAPMA